MAEGESERLRAQGRESGRERESRETERAGEIGRERGNVGERGRESGKYRECQRKKVID